VNACKHMHLNARKSELRKAENSDCHSSAKSVDSSHQSLGTSFKFVDFGNVIMSAVRK